MVWQLLDLNVDLRLLGPLVTSSVVLFSVLEVP